MQQSAQGMQFAGIGLDPGQARGRHRRPLASSDRRSGSRAEHDSPEAHARCRARATLEALSGLMGLPPETMRPFGDRARRRIRDRLQGSRTSTAAAR